MEEKNALAAKLSKLEVIFVELSKKKETMDPRIRRKDTEEQLGKSREVLLVL